MGKLRNKREIGFKYEKIAKKYLILRGLVFVEKNFSSRYGEIDLIFKDFENDETLVFVEVKYRKNRMYIFKYWKKIFRSFVGMLITKNKDYHRVVLKGRREGYKKYKM